MKTLIALAEQQRNGRLAPRSAHAAAGTDHHVLRLQHARLEQGNERQKNAGGIAAGRSHNASPGNLLPAPLRQAVHGFLHQGRIRVGVPVILFVHLRAVQTEIRAQVNHAHAPVHQAAGIGSSHAMRQGQKSDLRPSSGNRLHIGIRKLQTGTRNLTETGKNLPQRLPGILAGSSAHQLHPAMVQQDAQQFLPGVATGPDDCNLNLLHDKKGML